MGRRSLGLALGLLVLLGAAARWRGNQRERLSEALADIVLHEGMELEDRRASRSEHDAMDSRLARTAHGLLREGAEPDYPKDFYPAHYLAVRYEFPRTLEVLLTAGADPNRSSDRLPSLLSVAKQTQNRKIIAMLERAGARE